MKTIPATDNSSDSRAPFDWVARLDEIFPRDGQFIEPLSERWWQARRGRLTSSGAPHTIGPFKERGINTLMRKLEAEMQPGWEPTEISTPGLRWGRAHEKAAIANIELALGVDIADPGTIFHPNHPYCSATPDGRFDRVSVEIKCPHVGEKHLVNLYDSPILKKGPRGGRHKYYYQCQWEAWCMGAELILFASFDPDRPLVTRLAMTEIPIDFELFEVYEKNVRRFKNLFERGGSITADTIEPIGIPNLF